mgnify:CR=1 FL=1
MYTRSAEPPGCNEPAGAYTLSQLAGALLAPQPLGAPVLGDTQTTLKC